MNCIGTCNRNALKYGMKQSSKPQNHSRRNFLSIVALLASVGVARAQDELDELADGGLADIEEKRAPRRDAYIIPSGGENHRHFAAHCTACQLCVSSCPTHVLRPSTALERLMQPEMSYERGYCRPECTRCSEVCPTGAIKRVTTAEKSSTQIGHAVWVAERCIVNRDGVSCHSCERRCPAGAIQLVANKSAPATDPKAPKIPAVDVERCIGCGACENLCPARPLSAIYVEGHQRHKTV
jgi:formate hydrogenlyase subunit 6/NADH:ubiquinone oxidoreductase subunit I